MYKRHSDVECLLRWREVFDCIASRCEKRDVMFLGFTLYSLIVDALQ